MDLLGDEVGDVGDWSFRISNFASPEICLSSSLLNVVSSFLFCISWSYHEVPYLMCFS